MTHQKEELEQAYQEGMAEAYQLMDNSITSAIRRNEGAKSALQIINVFNEFTSHLHYQKSLLKDRMNQWEERAEPCEEPKEMFSHEIKALEDLLNSFGYATLKGAN